MARALARARRKCPGRRLAASPPQAVLTAFRFSQGHLIQPDPSCIMYYTYYIILCINTGRIISLSALGA